MGSRARVARSVFASLCVPVLITSTAACTSSSPGAEPQASDADAPTAPIEPLRCETDRPCIEIHPAAELDRGDAVLVRGAGFEPEERLDAMLCPVERADVLECLHLENAASDADGSFSFDDTMFPEFPTMFSSAPRLPRTAAMARNIDCRDEPCVVVVEQGRHTVEAAVAFLDGPRRAPPTLEAELDADSGTVTVTGERFLPGTRFDPHLCSSEASLCSPWFDDEPPVADADGVIQGTVLLSSFREDVCADDCVLTGYPHILNRDRRDRPPPLIPAPVPL